MKLWNAIKKCMWELKLKIMDMKWKFDGAYRYEIFPPSAYQRATPEEQEQMDEIELEDLRRMIDQLDD